MDERYARILSRLGRVRYMTRDMAASEPVAPVMVAAPVEDSPAPADEHLNPATVEPPPPDATERRKRGRPRKDVAPE